MEKILTYSILQKVVFLTKNKLKKQNEINLKLLKNMKIKWISNIQIQNEQRSSNQRSSLSLIDSDVNTIFP